MKVDKVLPKLEPKTRSREYDSYLEVFRDRVIYGYLFESKSHRSLDETVLGLNPVESKGYQSMGILHYLGLKAQHKGLFKGVDITTAVDIMENSKTSDFSMVIQALSRLVGQQRNDIPNDESIYEEDEKEYSEGRVAYRMHRYRERDTQLVKDAKTLFRQKHGSLYCEVCKTNFENIYGERGKDFIEAHHTKPVSEMNEGELTKVEDIAMLCSNCHRMIHRKPFISVEELRALVLR